jgi:phospholipid/cholesterol/gamma-HCH transport system substrate-binding protein
VKTKEFRVGLFIAIAIVMLYFGFNFLKGIDFFSRTNKYYAVYENSNQLAVSNPVLVNGFPIGRVSNIRMLTEMGNQVLVELEIESDIVLTDSTKAILNSVLLEGKSIILNIKPSKIKLKPGDTLQAIVAKGMFDKVSEKLETVDLQTTMLKLNETLNDLSKNSKQLDLILTNFQATPNLLNTTLITANGKINDLSGTFKSVAENFNGTLNELKPTLTNFKTLSDSLKMLKLNQTLTKTQQAISNLNQTLSRLNKGDNTMSKLMTEDTLYVNLNKLLRSLDSLAVNFNNNPKHFMAPLGKSKKKIDRDRRREQEEKKKAAAKK